MRARARYHVRRWQIRAARRQRSCRNVRSLSLIPPAQSRASNALPAHACLAPSTCSSSSSLKVQARVLFYSVRHASASGPAHAGECASCHPQPAAVRVLGFTTNLPSRSLAVRPRARIIHGAAGGWRLPARLGASPRRCSGRPSVTTSLRKTHRPFDTRVQSRTVGPHFSTYMVRPGIFGTRALGPYYRSEGTPAGHGKTISANTNDVAVAYNRLKIV